MTLVGAVTFDFVLEVFGDVQDRFVGVVVRVRGRRVVLAVGLALLVINELRERQCLILNWGLTSIRRGLRVRNDERHLEVLLRDVLDRKVGWNW